MADQNTKISCPDCGADMALDNQKLMFVCSYCGATKPLDKVTADRLNIQDIKEIERLHLESLREEAELKEEQEHKAKKQQAKKRRPAIILAVIVILFALFTVIGIATSSDSGYKLNDPYEWPATTIAQVVPQPANEYGRISSSTDTKLYADIKCESDAEFTAYKSALAEKGFTVDVLSSDYAYEGYNADGYYIEVYYDSSDKRMRVEAVAPIPFVEMQWPTSGIAQQLPAPESNKAYISSQDNDYLRVYVGDTTREQYASYVDVCINSGFDIDYSRSSDYFYGYNEEGTRLTVSYEGFNTMCVNIYNYN